MTFEEVVKTYEDKIKELFLSGIDRQEPNETPENDEVEK